jgi:inosine-uridine nucleoside N-ribohydrolase
MPEKVIIDTDPGIDDAMAIFFAMAHPEIELLGLTTTFGNVSVTQASANALTLVDLAGQKTPVAGGAATPSVQPARPFPAFVHGDDGFGNLHLPPPGLTVESRGAAEFIVDVVSAHPHEVTLVAIGPLGNLAAALNLDPDVARKAKRVVIMGGAVRRPGNVTPVAEANIICDPDAADVVFAAPWATTLVGLDVTNSVLMERALFQRIAACNPAVGSFLQRASDFYIDFHQQYLGKDRCRGHDVTALVYVVEPALFELLRGDVRVVTDGLAIGQTILAAEGHRYGPGWQGRSMVQACVDVNAQEVIRVFETQLSSDFWQKPLASR